MPSPLRANYLKTDSKTMVTQILDTLLQIIDDILKGTVNLRLTIIQRNGNIQSQTKLLSLGKKNLNGYCM